MHEVCIQLLGGMHVLCFEKVNFAILLFAFAHAKKPHPPTISARVNVNIRYRCAFEDGRILSFAVTALPAKKGKICTARKFPAICDRM